MTYNITFVYDKGIGVLNEDELLLNDPVFGVFDGATGLVPFKNKQGNSGGKIAAEIARDAFESTDGPLICRAKKANDLIRLAMEKEGIDQRKKEGVWTATAAAIRL